MMRISLSCAVAMGSLLSVFACSLNDAPGTGTPTAGAGGTGTSGSGAMPAGSSGVGTTGGGGVATGGTGSPAGGAGSGPTAGSAGQASTGGTTGAGGASGSGGMGGAAGGAAGGTAGAGGTGGAASCNGNAVSFNSNTAAGNDAAKARVEIDFAGSADLPKDNDNRTIEFWANVLTSSWSGDTNTMFFYGTNNRKADGFGLDFGGTKGTIDPFTNNFFDNDNQATGLDSSKDQWVHFAMTWDGTAVKAFVNGVEKASKTSSDATQKTLMTGVTAFIVGGYPPNFFNGAIDELRIWKVARSAADLTATMKKTLVGNEASLTAYYKFDEKTGTTAADSVTSAAHTAHPGTLMATSADKVPTWVAGVPLACP